MRTPVLFGLTLLFSLSACQPSDKQAATEATEIVQVAGAMKDVMWSGELAGKIALDTLRDADHLYAIGPDEYLRGELLTLDGVSYRSRIDSAGDLVVEAIKAVKAPFLVYARLPEAAWEAVVLPAQAFDLARLEAWLDATYQERKAPFALRLQGRIDSAAIHVQNLPPGTAVSSPQEAHQGQVNLDLGPGKADLVGFFSRVHQGIFTHHDSYQHLHLITADRQVMGHLDALQFHGDSMQLWVSRGE